MWCRNSCGFYANQGNDGYCSKCKMADSYDSTEQLTTEQLTTEVSETLKAADQCIVCGKKVKISTVQCKCKQPLCKLHVMESQHQCSYDYKKHGQEILNKQNPRICGPKLK